MSVPGANVLVIEDSSADREAIGRAFLEATALTYTCVADAEAARAYLSGAASPPKLILLDYLLPGQTGLDFLQWLRAHPRHTGIPVVILSGKLDAAVIQESYRSLANSVVPKPSDLDGYRQLVTALDALWLRSMARME